ncbi:MAG: pseudouridine synthase [Patescibacteria group bacterium]
MLEITYPIRINRYLSSQNIASRREADRLIVANKVKINGRLAKLGDQVNKDDQVEVDQVYLGAKEKSYQYLAFNKPKGVVTNTAKGQTAISDLVNPVRSKPPQGGCSRASGRAAFNGVKTRAKLVPIGRLDKESGGLIILTNDTRITGKLLSPEFNHEKEYLVKVDKSLTPMFQKQITAGVKLEDDWTKPCRLKKVEQDEFYLTLTEGKKHQIRRMCAALGYQVKNLRRVRIMNIELGQLKPGKWREITGSEKDQFLNSLNS